MIEKYWGTKEVIEDELWVEIVKDDPWIGERVTIKILKRSCATRMEKEASAKTPYWAETKAKETRKKGK